LQIVWLWKVAGPGLEGTQEAACDSAKDSRDIRYNCNMPLREAKAAAVRAQWTYKFREQESTLRLLVQSEACCR